jgi:flagella basal body P-ring formation protein FlgA
MINAPQFSRFRVLILLIPFVMILSAFSPVFGLEITIEQKMVVKGDIIRLGDIAKFNPVNDSRVSQLKGIEISSSPAPGSDSTITKDLMIYKINPYISGDKEILIRMPENLKVSRSAQFISSQRMEEIFRSYVKDNSGWPEDQIGFEGINTPGTIALPEGKLDWEVQYKGKEDLIGNVALTIDFSIDEKSVKKVNLSGKVGVKREIIKAFGKIDRGRIITAQDITPANESSLHYRKDSLISREDVIGKRAIRTIQAGQEIISGMIENPPPVKKGDRVIISAENSEMKITAAGEALQDGQTGDQVEVLNVQSGRKIFATVRGSGIVEVIF